jgi:TusA-related sulfurtransferase
LSPLKFHAYRTAVSFINSGADGVSMRVDVRGLPCPQPTAAVRRKLSELADGEELVVEGADRAAAASVRRACERHGFDVTSEGETLVIRRTELSSL